VGLNFAWRRRQSRGYSLTSVTWRQRISIMCWRKASNDKKNNYLRLLDDSTKTKRFATIRPKQYLQMFVSEPFNLLIYFRIFSDVINCDLLGLLPGTYLKMSYAKYYILVQNQPWASFMGGVATGYMYPTFSVRPLGVQRIHRLSQ